MTPEESLKVMTKNRDYWYEMYKESLASYAQRVSEAESLARSALAMLETIKERIALALWKESAPEEVGVGSTADEHVKA